MGKGSLEMLLRNHTPATAPHTKSQSALSEHIQALHLRVLELLNAHDFSNPDLVNIIGHDFRANMEGTPAPDIFGRDDLIARHKRMVEEFPNYRIETLDMEIFEEGIKEDEVKLWYLVRVENHPAEGVRKEGVLVLTWVRRNGLWKSVLQEGLRGVNAFG